MNELPEIYRRIEYLRNKGVKMKEIADHTNMAASVLSSLYSSVLPTYIGCSSKAPSLSPFKFLARPRSAYALPKSGSYNFDILFFGVNK